MSTAPAPRGMTKAEREQDDAQLAALITASRARIYQELAVEEARAKAAEAQPQVRQAA